MSRGRSRPTIWPNATKVKRENVRYGHECLKDNMSREYATKLRTATREKLKKFNSLRGRQVQPGEFWDVVVLTAVDGDQRGAYELQMAEKVKRKELPRGPHYKIFSDPPGCKIGNGGSTLYALQQLSDAYGEALSSLRVLLIHAGGFSQRLPIASALGKVFAAMPLGDPLYQMLEIKLALYVDFPSRMNPGVLVCAADCLELYCVTEDDGALFDKPGFTALAHPSSLMTGTTHGVFVLDPSSRSADLEMEKIDCLRFLHKPSVAEMRANGAVCGGSSCSPDAEFVYTDSTFYFDFQTSVSLLNLLKELEPLTCEIDAYGDFLQALGRKATVDYTGNTANVTKEENSLVETRKRIFHCLKGTPLNVLVLNISKFYHIGTTAEYLFHFTEDAVLRGELGLLMSAFSLPMTENPEEVSGGVVMQSVLHPGCSVGARSVVEYSRLEAGVCIGEGSIISSCWVSEGLSVPDGILVHSLCVHQKQRSRFVTVVFGIDDNLKLRSGAPRKELKLFGRSLEECLSHWELEDQAVRFSGDESRQSLWEARLFPVCPDHQTSFSMSLAMLHSVLSGSTFRLPRDTSLMSMHEALKCKNLEEMLKFRKGLYDEIIMSKANGKSKV